MRIGLFIISLFFYAQLLADAKEFKVGDTLFVWADNGILIRTQPSMTSEVI
jgi:hypothetical protein